MIDPLRRLRVERAAYHLHALGRRATYEFVDALIQHASDPQFILDQLDSYGRLTPTMIRIAGADHPPAPPLRVVQS